MKTKLNNTVGSALAFLLITLSPSYATSLGLDVGTGSYAIWDNFSANNFTGETPDSSNTGAFSSTLALTSSAMLLGGADNRVYGNAGTIDFTLSNVATTGIGTLALQLKFTSPAFTTAANLFTVNLTGVGAGTQAFLGTVTEGANTFNIYQWSWTGLSIAPSSSFEITAHASADHCSVDTVAISDAIAVPEPSTYALMALGALALVLKVSRKHRLIA